MFSAMKLNIFSLINIKFKSCFKLFYKGEKLFNAKDNWARSLSLSRLQTWCPETHD